MTTITNTTDTLFEELLSQTLNLVKEQMMSKYGEEPDDLITNCYTFHHLLIREIVFLIDDNK